MKNSKMELKVVMLVAGLLVLAALPVTADLPHSAIVVGNLSVPQGGTATVSIIITEASNDISSVDLDLLYNPAVITPVALSGTEFDNFISNEPAPGQIKIVAYQGGGSLTAPAKVTDVTFQGVGGTGANTSLTLEGRSYMGTGSPYGDITLTNGSGTITTGVPVLNAMGMVALVGLLALVLLVTTRKRR